ncbi:MAG: DUF4058 family protein [Planctomycetaceae bacterium]|nr:DUF4058 family protein [Planctomycetaceae bacterium]
MRFQANPFPGMNPWLENSWRDVHAALTTYARDHLQDQLPSDLQAQVETYLSVAEFEQTEIEQRNIAPGVSIVEQPNMLRDDDSAPGSMFVSEEPIRVVRVPPQQTLRFIQIRESRGERKFITVIEFLSPSNKATAAGRQQYLAKQSELLSAGVNLVEIDLLRAGGWVMATPRDLCPTALRHPYRVRVVRANNVREAEIYPATFAKPLPTIRIPLRPTDADVPLPLQMLLNQAYERGRYGNDIDYSQAPDPLLEEAEQRWLNEHLKEAKNASRDGWH